MEEFRKVLDKDGEPLDTRWQDRLEEKLIDAITENV